MTNLCKSLSLLPLQNAIRNFQTIKIETDINDKPRSVKNFHYCNSNPKLRKNPVLIGLSKKSSQLLKIDYQEILNDSQSGKYLSGAIKIHNLQPICHNYSGHQFGVWANQLGDGRAHTLGTVKLTDRLLELQIKGSGLSPFSRHADGNSVVSSAVRQFFASQLMFALGVPTSRALSLVIADENVVRDPMYNGVLKTEKAAIVLRIAPTFLRFGSFEVCKGQCNFQDNFKNRQHLLPLANYIIQNFYPEIDQEQRDPYEQLFEKIVIQTAKLVAHWQSVGFVHGVLNTDNMSMVNVTIDYGPFGFIDYFSKDYVSNATDQFERYSYRRQADVVKWNLQRLAEAFDYLVPEQILKKIIETSFFVEYRNKYNELFCKKLGLNYQKIPKQDITRIIEQLMNTMHICGSHFTNVFRAIEAFQNQKNPNIEEYASKFSSFSCPKQYFVKLIRAFPSMKADLQKILKQDYGFNQYFVTEQKQRKFRLQRLIHQDCKARSQREIILWKKWLQQFTQLLTNYPSIEKGKSIKYVLLNQIAVNITEQLKLIQQIKEKRAFVSKFLQVFENPYEYNEWFQKKYWNILPAHIKLTCSS